MFLITSSDHFINMALNFWPNIKLMKNLIHYTKDWFTGHVKCNICDETLSVLHLEKFIKPQLDNIGRTKTNLLEKRKRVDTKPLSRKIMKV